MTAQENLNSINKLSQDLRANIEKVVVSNNEALDLAIVAVLCNGHILIEDVPGIGKTTLAKSLAQSLGCTFKRIQFTPDLTPTDVLGTNIYNQRSGDFDFRPGPIFTQLLLGDEINRATPRTQSALLEAMQERQITIEGTTTPLPDPFIVLATQNPIEMEGTFPLPEAQLDRFMLKISIGYPSFISEGLILSRFQREVNPNELINPVIAVDNLLRVQRLVPEITVAESVREYLIHIVRATRINPSLDLGASPRATLFLYRAAQAFAAIHNRPYVLPDDIKFLALPVLGHRLLISPQSRLRGQTVDSIIQEVLDSVPVPVG